MSGRNDCVNRNREQQADRRRQINRRSSTMDVGRELTGDVCDRQSLVDNQSRNRDRNCRRQPTTS